MLELKGLRVLVTGGAGFIGSHLVDQLIKRKDHVIAYDNFDEYYLGKVKNISHHLENRTFKLIRSDILAFEGLCEAMKNIDAVFHLAAQPGVRFSMENPMKTHNVNVTGTLSVLRAAKKAGVKRVVFASSSSVYGVSQYLPINETHPTNPISIYGSSKLAAETYCRMFNDTLRLPIVILRYHTVYGPRQRPDMAIHTWTRRVFEGKPLAIYGDGTQTRDFTYVDDIVRGTIAAAEVEGIEGEVFNLGSGQRISINDVVQLLIRFSGKDDVKVNNENSKLGDVKDTHADISKAKKELGYRPSVAIEEGIKLFIDWFVKRTGLEHIKLV